MFFNNTRIRASVFMRAYLAIALAFTLPIAASTAAYASEQVPTPSQLVAQYQATYAEYNARLTTYTTHVNTYDPANAQTVLDPARSAMATFLSEISQLEAAATQYTTAITNKSQADAALTAQNQLIATALNQLQAAQIAATNTAAALQDANTQAYQTALSEYNTAKANSDAANTSTAYTETFTNNSRTQPNLSITAGGTPVSTTNNQGIVINSAHQSGSITGGSLTMQSTPLDLTINPTESNVTEIRFDAYAKNGDSSIITVMLDGSQQTTIFEDNIQQPNYVSTEITTSAAGTFIDLIRLPANWDYYIIDNIRVTTAQSDPALLAITEEKYTTLTPLKNLYDAAYAADQTSTSQLQTKQAAYDIASTQNILAQLQTNIDNAQTALDAQLPLYMVAQLETITAKQDALTALNTLESNLPPTSLVVTSNADTLDPGTLRWAITQANAVEGGYFDKITFNSQLVDPIVLTANLPTITQTVTIVGNGQSSTVINGASMHAAFFLSNASKTLNLSDLTIERTKRADWQQGSGVFVARGTANISRVTFQDIATGSAVTTKEGGSYITITDSIIRRITQYGVFSNYGSTPTTTTESDTPYDNRITINSTLFNNNGAAIYGERTVIVNNSTFKNNGYGFRMQGINKHRVTGSLFQGNQYDIYTSAWIPTTWTTYFDAPSRVITGNTFQDTVNIPIVIDDNFNDGKKTARTAYISQNSWDEATTNFVKYANYDTTLASNQQYYLNLGSPTTQPPFTYAAPTSIKPVILAPTNLVATTNPDNSVTLTWTASQANYTQVERYAVSWTTGSNAGWGVAAYGTSITLTPDMFATTGGLGLPYTFTVRGDNDTSRIYSATSEPVQATLFAGPPTGDYIIQEGGARNFQAPEGKKFATISAWYGSPYIASCGADVSEQYSQLINGLTNVDLFSSNQFGDPCGGVPKVLILSNITYTDIPVILPPVVIPTPEPTPTPTPTPEPEPTPTETPTPEPTPTTEPEPEPTPEPTVEPSPEPTLEPEPEPTIQPTKEPEVPVEEEPEEEPIKEITSVEELPEVISAELLTKIDLTEIVATDLNPAQAEALKEAALETFETAVQGSPAYEQALDALYIAAAADDIVLSEELAAIPGAEELVAALNFMSNVGADLSPKVREEAQKATVAAVIVGQIAGAAVAATSSASGASGGSSSGRRIK